MDIRLGVKAPVFCMAIEPNAKLLAVGVGNEVHIMQDASHGKPSLCC